MSQSHWDAPPSQPLDTAARVRARLRNLLAVGILVGLCGMAGYAAHGLWIGSEQDQCNFGPVSNARYQEWYAKAKALRQREGPLISLRVVLVEPERKSYQKVTDILFDELSRGVTSVEERIAIVHAMMRADGFLLLSTDPDLADPYAKADLRVAFNYGKYSLWGLVLLCQFDCKHRAYANLSLQDRSSAGYPRDRRNQFEFSYSPGPELISLTRYYVPPPQHPRTCPPMPTPEWAARLIEPKKER